MRVRSSVRWHGFTDRSFLRWTAVVTTFTMLGDDVKTLISGSGGVGTWTDAAIGALLLILVAQSALRDSARERAETTPPATVTED